MKQKKRRKKIKFTKIFTEMKTELGVGQDWSLLLIIYCKLQMAKGAKTDHQGRLPHTV